MNRDCSSFSDIQDAFSLFSRAPPGQAWVQNVMMIGMHVNTEHTVDCGVMQLPNGTKKQEPPNI